MIRKTCLAALFVAGLAMTVTTNEPGAQDAELPEVAPHILRQPALSPDGMTLAFAYDGDIWTVPAEGGTARRLTVTVDNDSDPIFSPDGNWLAFRSRRYGDDDVFVMPAEGGPARRLTHSDAWDYPYCWLPDSSAIIFSSYRQQNSRDLYAVRLDGGEPWPITGGGLGVHEYHAQISPDGRRIVYVNRGGDPATRRGYEGTANGEIWVCDFDGVTTSNHRRLTNNRSHDASPRWLDDNEILYVTYAQVDSGSSRIADLARMDAEGNPLPRFDRQMRLDPKELTSGGDRIAFSTGSYGGWKIHLWDRTARHPFQVVTPDIRIATDVRTAEYRETTLTNASEFAVSPDGKKIAFIAGGDVFVMPADEDGVPVQITDTVQEEKGVSWGPNSEKLVWVNAIGGQHYIYDLVRHFAGEPQLPSVQVNHDAAWPTVDPHGRVFAYAGEEAIRQIGSLGEEEVDAAVPVEGNFHGAALGSTSWSRFAVSPDGVWVVFEEPNENYQDRLMIGNTKTGETRAISHLYGSASHPRFSGDGKRVVFINHQEGSYDVWKIDLVRDEPRFKESKVEELFRKDDNENGEDDTDEEADKEGDEEDAVEIDFEGIKDRTERITSLSGNEYSPVALSDGKTYCFIGNVQGQSNVWKLEIDPFDGPDLNQLTRTRTSKSSLALSPDEKSLWWLDNGTITSMATKGGKTTSYSFRVTQRRNRSELRGAAFQEAVHVMDRYYYDPDHHGIDWRAAAERYERALGSVRTGDEYDVLMDEMLGELNSSHQGYSARDSRSDGVHDNTGYLGLIFDPAELSRGRYRVTEVLRRGPCDVPTDAPEAGHYLVAVNGDRLGGDRVLAQHLLNTVGKKTVLTFANEAEGEGDYEVPVKPRARTQMTDLWYERWVEWQRSIVDEHSEGRLGYVHIRAMNNSSLDQFKHHLGNEMLGKDGVVIDVRFNGGGRTAVDILEIMIKRPWLKRQRAGLEPISENVYRSVALEKPSILLINQASFSNAEIMAEGFRRLELGKIVGVETAGGVIGTGRLTLVDGSTMRLPSTGAYTVDMENLELKGREPDIHVENNPDELDQGIDRQTERAVEELLKQLDE